MEAIANQMSCSAMIELAKKEVSAYSYNSLFYLNDPTCTLNMELMNRQMEFKLQVSGNDTRKKNIPCDFTKPESLPFNISDKFYKMPINQNYIQNTRCRNNTVLDDKYKIDINN